MTLNPGPNDALVFFLLGDSNSQGWQNEADEVVGQRFTTSPSDCYIWSKYSRSAAAARFTAATDSANDTWIPLTGLFNYQLAAQGPEFYIAHEMRAAYGPQTPIYCLKLGVGSASAAISAAAINAVIAWNPEAENTVANTLWEIFATYYVQPAITNLRTNVRGNIYVDGCYYCGDGVGSQDPAGGGATATAGLVEEVGGGMSALFRALEAQILLPRGTLPVVATRSPLAFATATIGSLTKTTMLRDEQTRWLAASEQPAALVEGSAIPLRVSDRAHFTSTGYAMLGERMFRARNGLGSAPRITAAPLAAAPVID